MYDLHYNPSYRFVSIFYCLRFLGYLWMYPDKIANAQMIIMFG